MTTTIGSQPPGLEMRGFFSLLFVVAMYSGNFVTFRMKSGVSAAWSFDDCLSDRLLANRSLTVNYWSCFPF